MNVIKPIENSPSTNTHTLTQRQNNKQSKY